MVLDRPDGEENISRLTTHRRAPFSSCRHGLGVGPTRGIDKGGQHCVYLFLSFSLGLHRHRHRIRTNLIGGFQDYIRSAVVRLPEVSWTKLVADGRY